MAIVISEERSNAGSADPFGIRLRRLKRKPGKSPPEASNPMGPSSESHD